ncbi:MAG TPA: SH3 domain-containing protein, partial [Polyangiaceae bacterium]
CQPFTSKAYALANLAWAGPLMLAGIAAKVNPRVVPLWARYIAGGSSPTDLTASFGKDFTASPTTTDTTQYLIGELRRDVAANLTSLLGGANAATVNFTPRLSAALAAIDDPNQPEQMNFNIPSDIAGNVAGGIGKDETTFKIGAQPSPFDDSREAEIKATLLRRADGSVEVTPHIAFTVKDTIDLCPGDCGTAKEQVATVPLSRFEATGVSGDVPLIVRFPAPAAELTPFVVPAPAPPAPATVPVTGTVKAFQLNIRARPSTSAAVLGQYRMGEVITLSCQSGGIGGATLWYKTNRGFVSARYVTLAAASTLPKC